VKDIDFNSLVPALENKSVDFVISGMTPTEKREQSVDFSDIYYTAKQSSRETVKSKLLKI
jgi:polar amino acid transport system substrate-binding protein